MPNTPLTHEEQVLLDWLREVGEAPTSPSLLLGKQRPAGVSSLALQGALWRLVDRGAARFTADRKIELTERP